MGEMIEADIQAFTTVILRILGAVESARTVGQPKIVATRPARAMHRCQRMLSGCYRRPGELQVRSERFGASRASLRNSERFDSS